MPNFLGVPVDAAYHLVSGLTGILMPVLGGLAAVAAIVVFTMAVRLLLMPLSLRALRGQAVQGPAGPATGGAPPAVRQAAGAAAARDGRTVQARGHQRVRRVAPLLLQWPFLSVMYLLFRSPTVGGTAAVAEQAPALLGVTDNGVRRFAVRSRRSRTGRRVWAHISASWLFHHAFSVVFSVP